MPPKSKTLARYIPVPDSVSDCIYPLPKIKNKGWVRHGKLMASTLPLLHLSVFSNKGDCQSHSRTDSRSL